MARFVSQVSPPVFQRRRAAAIQDAPRSPGTLDYRALGLGGPPPLSP